MKTRIITGSILVAILVSLLFLSNTIIFAISISLVSLIGVIELFSANKYGGYIPLLISSTAIAVLLPMLARGYTRGYIPVSFIITACFAYAIACICCVLYKHGKINPEKIGFTLAMTFYICFGLCSLIFLIDKAYGTFYFILAVICAWVTDAGAYFIGSFFGKRKLSPNLSPNKTVEGAIGGIVVNVIISMIFSLIYSGLIVKGTTVSFIVMFIAIIIGSVLSMIGDLFASALKRYYKIKDFGNLMPGHGGVIDRFDSVLIVAPFFVVLTQYISLIK